MSRNRKGFTLIELLIVVVIIGILAAIAIPKFANTKEKAYLASMKSDLRNIATAQEGYFSDFQLYTDMSASNIAGAASQDAATGFVPSASVTITATADGGLGWQAEATHEGTTKTCDIFIGESPGSAGVATVEGEPRCTS
jgi:type IV pilus assembly protein PilA